MRDLRLDAELKRLQAAGGRFFDRRRDRGHRHNPAERLGLGIEGRSNDQGFGAVFPGKHRTLGDDFGDLADRPLGNVAAISTGNGGRQEKTDDDKVSQSHDVAPRNNATPY